MRRLRRFGLDAAILARARRGARIGSRLLLLATVVCVLVLTSVQIARIIAQNVVVARELAATRSQIAALQAREQVQRRTIVRLSDPRGAVPEIHDKLHVVGNREEIIYVRGAAPAAAPGDWHPQP